MAKGSRGGKRTGASISGMTINMAQKIANSPVQNQANQQPQVDTTQQAQAFSTNYDNFMKMTDDQKAQAIANLSNQDVPVFLADNDFQKFTYNLGLNDKLQLVDDNVLDTMTGTELFRNVNAINDTRNRIRYNADDIASQVQRGSVTRVSDNGGSSYGRGIYFADDYGESSFYGKTKGNIKKTAVVRCKLNSNAKVISYNKATSGLRQEISSGSKLGKALSKCDHASQVSLYAMAKGYNVIHSGHSYYNILSRNAVTMSSTIKARSNKW